MGFWWFSVPHMPIMGHFGPYGAVELRGTQIGNWTPTTLFQGSFRYKLVRKLSCRGKRVPYPTGHDLLPGANLGWFWPKNKCSTYG